MQRNNYSTYELEDFLSDESFQNWALRTNREDIAFWEEWIEKNSGKKQTVEIALSLLTKLQFTEQPVPDATIQQNWQQLNHIIRTENSDTGHPIYGNKKKRVIWSRIAAVVAGIALFTAVVYTFIRTRKDTYQSGFGEMLTLTLPDGSKAILNGNSTLSYAPTWNDAELREVWLKGEGFFSVTPTTHHQKFIVHISGGNEVEVLGTEFNVSDRKSGTRIVLSSGKVRLHLNEGELSRQIIMKPGELVEVSQATKAPAIKRVNPVHYTSWKNKELVFDNTPLREIALMLQETYGLETIITDGELANKKVSGTIPVENVDVLLEALSLSFQLKITRNQNKVTVENNP
jgi:ferric-dicitrate binding protein FerR (iron transport regulator)